MGLPKSLEGFGFQFGRKLASSVEKFLKGLSFKKGAYSTSYDVDDDGFYFSIYRSGGIFGTTEYSVEYHADDGVIQILRPSKDFPEVHEVKNLSELDKYFKDIKENRDKIYSYLMKK